MKTPYTRAMAFIAFFYTLYYVETTASIDHGVLYFMGAIIAIWALGRATLVELMKIWKGDA